MRWHSADDIADNQSPPACESSSTCAAARRLHRVLGLAVFGDTTPTGSEPNRRWHDSRVMAPDTDRTRWVALVVCCSAMFMTLLDVSVTNVALPSISDSTGAGPSELQWIVSGYTLAFGLVPVLGGKLGDDHGRRVMFQVGVGGFVVTSALSGLAPTAGF